MNGNITRNSTQSPNVRTERPALKPATISNQNIKPVRSSDLLGDGDSIFWSLFDSTVFRASLAVRGYDGVSDLSKHLPSRKRNARHPSFPEYKQLPITVEVSLPQKLSDCQSPSKLLSNVSRHKHKRPLWVNQVLSEYSEEFLRKVDSYIPIIDVEVL